MKSNNLFKKLFATIAVFATLATTGVNATVHADTGSQSYLDQIKQYGIDHGYANADGTPGPKVQSQTPKKTTIDAKSEKYGYYKDYGNDKSGDSGFTVYQYNQYPSEMRTAYGVNTGSQRNDIYRRVPSQLVYIDGLGMNLRSNGIISGQSTSKEDDKIGIKLVNSKTWSKTTPETYLTSLPTIPEIVNSNQFINVAYFYHKWLHLDINKLLTNTKPKNWKSMALNGHKNNYMDKGYSKAWLSKKLVYLQNNKSELKKEQLKYYKQSLLKDQRQTSTANDFDNTTLK